MADGTLIATQAAADFQFETESIALVDDLLAASPDDTTAACTTIVGTDRLRLFVMYNNVLTHYGRNAAEMVPVEAFLPEGWPLRLCCPKHQARSVAKYFLRKFPIGSHTTYRCRAPADSVAKPCVRSARLRQYMTAIENMEFFSRGIRCCEVLGVGGSPSLVAVTHRYFLNTTLYEVAANEGPALRETLAGTCMQRINCEDCCMSEALLLFRKFHPEAITPRHFMPLTVVQETHDETKPFTPLIESRAYASQNRLDKQNSLLWYFAGVENCLLVFQCCIVELKSLLKLRTYAEAIQVFHTNVLELYLRRPAGERHWDTLQATHIRPRLQAHHVYLHTMHQPRAQLQIN